MGNWKSQTPSDELLYICRKTGKTASFIEWRHRNPLIDLKGTVFQFKASEFDSFYVKMLENGVRMSFYHNPLSLAIRYGHFGLVCYLIQKIRFQISNTLLDDEAKLSFMCDQIVISPLHFAVVANNLPIAQYLLSHCADANEITYNDELNASVLHIAASKGFINMMKLLLRYGANPKLADRNGKTSLDWAKAAKRYQAVELLKTFSHTN